ncbi:MAG: DUF1259 domain-containing protein [Bacteroidota bacterium]
MKRSSLVFACALMALPAAGTIPASAQTRLDTARIESLTGAKGALDAKSGVFKVTVPRTDVTLDVAGARIIPSMGLASWAAFQRMGARTMVMGDLVLLEDQVNPVMSVALDNGLDVTALHNHFLWDSPRVMFMHIGGMGEQDRLASAIGAVFKKIQETSGGRGETPHAEIDPAHMILDPAKIDAVLGHKGDLKDGVYKIVWGRTTRMHGEVVGSTMGVNTWAAFAGSDERAVVDGDFVMLEPELRGVLKALRGAGIDIVAIHQHMVEEVPRTVFLHYWGVGPTESLAKGLKAALSVTGEERRSR